MKKNKKLITTKQLWILLILFILVSVTKMISYFIPFVGYGLLSLGMFILVAVIVPRLLKSSSEWKYPSLFGLLFVICGGLMNLTVMTFNNFKMPYFDSGRINDLIESASHQPFQHISQINLYRLSDIYYSPMGIYSFGDLVALIGVGIMVIVAVLQIIAHYKDEKK